jgi:hypothetical protein
MNELSIENPDGQVQANCGVLRRILAVELAGAMESLEHAAKATEQLAAAGTTDESHAAVVMALSQSAYLIRNRLFQGAEYLGAIDSITLLATLERRLTHSTERLQTYRAAGWADECRQAAGERHGFWLAVRLVTDAMKRAASNTGT